MAYVCLAGARDAPGAYFVLNSVYRPFVLYTGTFAAASPCVFNTSTATRIAHTGRHARKLFSTTHKFHTHFVRPFFIALNEPACQSSFCAQCSKTLRQTPNPNRQNWITSEKPTWLKIVCLLRLLMLLFFFYSAVIIFHASEISCPFQWRFYSHCVCVCRWPHFTIQRHHLSFRHFASFSIRNMYVIYNHFPYNIASNDITLHLSHSLILSTRFWAVALMLSYFFITFTQLKYCRCHFSKETSTLSYCGVRQNRSVLSGKTEAKHLCKHRVEWDR